MPPRRALLSGTRDPPRWPKYSRATDIPGGYTGDLRFRRGG